MIGNIVKTEWGKGQLSDTERLLIDPAESSEGILMFITVGFLTAVGRSADKQRKVVERQQLAQQKQGGLVGEMQIVQK